MNLFDPSRARYPVSGRPMYYHNLKTVAAVPIPDVEPIQHEDGGLVWTAYRFSVMLKTGDNRFEWHSCENRVGERIDDLFSFWVSDPERFMKERLNYAGPDAKEGIDLDALRRDSPRVSTRTNTRTRSAPAPANAVMADADELDL